MDSWTDAELVAAARARNTRAFSVLVVRHQSFVFGVAQRVVRDPKLAEDIAQETFFRAWQNLDSFRGDSAFRSWLYSIAHHAAVNVVTRTREIPTDNQVELVEPRTTESQVEAQHVERDYQAVIAKLAPELRAPFLLRERDGLAYEEIAERLGIPLNTVRTRIHRARNTVAEGMEEWR